MSYQNRRYRVVAGKVEKRWDGTDEPGWFKTKVEAWAAVAPPPVSEPETSLPEPEPEESQPATAESEADPQAPEAVEKPAEILAEKYAPHHPPKKPRGRPRKHF